MWSAQFSGRTGPLCIGVTILLLVLPPGRFPFPPPPDDCGVAGSAWFAQPLRKPLGLWWCYRLHEAAGHGRLAPLGGTLALGVG